MSLIASATEIAWALGFGDRLVGRSHECTLPPGIERLPVVTEPKLDIHAPSGAIDARVKELGREGLSVYRVDAERVRALRARRDPRAWRAALDALERAARGDANLMPALIDAVKAWATVGEIASRLRAVFGEHRETLVL